MRLRPRAPTVNVTCVVVICLRCLNLILEFKTGSHEEDPGSSFAPLTTLVNPLGLSIY